MKIKLCILKYYLVQYDEHNPIGQGTINWESVYEVMKNTSLAFKLVFEYKTGTEVSILREHKSMLLNCLEIK